MLKTSSFTGSSIILQLIDAADKNEIGGSKSGNDKTSLSNPFASKKSTRAGYLTLESAKRGDGNTKKSVKAAKSPNYLTSAVKKTFNHLRHTFTQSPIFQHFDLE